MSEVDFEGDPLDVLMDDLVEDFVRRHRQGESPTIGEYAARHPQMGESIRRTFTAALLLEKVKSDALTVAPAAAPSAVPERLGDYRIVREIGRGGMGIVYEAQQETLDRRVALKVLNGASLSPAALQRFLREARATARLHHTNIVPLFGVGDGHGVHYYAMQFIDGQGLDAVIRNWAAQDPPAPASRWNTVASICAQIGEALAYAHGKGILHRDVKPSNVMLDARGTAWLTDFGLAKLDEQPDLTRAIDMIGTLRYLAPERLAGRCDARSDVFSAGLVLYELLTLRPARGATERHQLIRHISDSAPLRPRQVDRRIPADLETIVLTATAPDPAHRYASAADFAHDLRCFLDNRPIRARRISGLERLRRWSRRNPALAAVSGSLIALLIASTVGSMFIAARFHGLADRESRAGRDADSARHSAEEALARVYPADGLTAARRGNNAEAALWFANAALLSPDSDARLLNSIRGRMFARGAITPIAAMTVRGAQVDVARFDPTGKYLLIRTADSESHPPSAPVQIWDVARETQVPLPVDPQEITSITWSPDGRLVALATAEGDVSTWTFPVLKPQRLRHFQSPIGSVEFSGDGRLLAIGEGPRVHLCDAMTAAPIAPMLVHPADVSFIRFSANSDKLLAMTGAGRVQEYALPIVSANPLFSFTARPRPAPLFVDEGKQVVATETGALATDAGSLTWRDSATGQIRCRVALPVDPDWLACDAASRHVAVAAGDQVKLFDAHTGREISSVPNYRRDTRCAAIDPEGSMLLSGSADRQPALWDVGTGAQLPIGLGALGTVRSVLFAPAGRSFAAVGTGGLVRVWSLPGSALPGFRVPVTGQDVSMRLDRPGRFALATGVSSGFGSLGATRVIDLETGQPAGADIRPGGTITAADFSPDGRHVATANQDGTSALLQFWEWKTAARDGDPHPLPAPADGICYNAAGSRIAVLCANGHVLIVRPADRSPACRWQVAPSKGASKLVRGGGIRFAPDDSSVLTWGSTNVEVHDPVTGALRYPPLRHEQICGDVRFSPDGKYLATAAWDKTVRIWEFATGRPVGSPLVHGDAVHLVQFVGDGRQLLTGCMDGVFRLWDSRSGQLVYPPARDDEVAMSAAATPDGRWLLMGSGEQTLRVWERSTGTLVTPPLPVSAACWAIEVSSNGRYAVATGLGTEANVFRLADLYPAAQPDLSDLIRWCEILSGQRLDGGQLVRLSDGRWLSLWRQYRASHRS